MNNRILGLALAGACFGATAALHASDFVGVYGVVEKVVLEPSDTAPQRIQIWGAFAIADKNDGSSYRPAERGYLYYACPPGREAICRAEWADLKSVAGKGTGVGFGQRWENNGHVRKAAETPSTPDGYVIQNGVVKVEKASDRGAYTLHIVEGLRDALKQPLTR